MAGSLQGSGDWYGINSPWHLMEMKRPKLIYVPGLISLLALPVMLLIIGPEDKKPFSRIRMILSSDEKPGPEGNIKYTRYTVYEALEKKKITAVEFWYEPWGDRGSYIYNSKLEFIRREIQRMTFTHDTTSVLKVGLGDGIIYGDFVWILNQLIIHEVKRYALVDDDLYIFANEPPAPLVMLKLEPIDCVDIVEPGSGIPTRWEIFIDDVKENLRVAMIIIKRNYLYFSGFVLLIGIPGLYRMVRRLLML